MTATTTEEAEEGAAVETADDAPVTLRIVRGEPTPEELAALVAVLAMRGSGGAEPTKEPKASGWTDRSRYMRAGLWHTHASGDWRTSAYPQ